MPQVIAFDTETWLIEPGLLAPPLVCAQWKSQGEHAQISHRDDPLTLRMVEGWLDGPAVLVGHNVAYDMAVIMAQWPHLTNKIFAKYNRDEITDTLLREQLIMISRGTFRSYKTADGESKAINYTLGDCVYRHLGRQMPKEGWRLFYRVFDGTPNVRDWAAVAIAFQNDVRLAGVPQWAQDVDIKHVYALLTSRPDEPVRYALADADETLALYESQERQFAPRLKDQFRQARAAFALHLSSCWGVYTDPEAVQKLETNLRQEFDALQFELQQAGLIRDNGTADTAAAKAAMVDACAEEGLPVLRTKGGDVSLAAEACDRFDETSTIGLYSKFLTLRKTISNDLKMLRSGCETPIQPRYGLADTGRTTCSGPNIQAINRGAGIREAFRPRPGMVFAQADFEGLELHTLAAWCLERVGWSKLADELNKKVDVHTAMAAELLGIPYEEAMRRKKAGDAEIKEYRQRAKALNFGLPGGLGAKKFVLYSKASYGVVLTEAEAVHYKSSWLRRLPEMNEHFRMAAVATSNPDKLGDEESLFTERFSGGVRYSSLCNRRFQGLGADAAKEALWRVTEACYARPESPLYGTHVVAFVHDEIIIEAPEARGHDVATELGRLMREGADKYLYKVPTRTEPLLMRVWSKSAEPTYDENKRLIAWEPKHAEL